MHDKCYIEIVTNNVQRNKAIDLRKEGMSYREIEKELGVARSTLSGWLKHLHMSEEQKAALRRKWVTGTQNGRKLGSMKNHLLKEQRLNFIDKEVGKSMIGCKFERSSLEVLMAGLYLGDGFKNGGRVGLGNANPDNVLLFVTLLRTLYRINESKLRAQIFARLDQNENELINYWSRLLNIPKQQFHKTQFDKRTGKSITRADYRGVCAVNYNDTLLQRRILAIGQEMIKYVSTLKVGS